MKRENIMSGVKANGNGAHFISSGLEEKLWAAADKMRGHMDAAEYKHVVLGLIFLKYLSDIFQEYYSELGNSQLDPENPENYRQKNIFWIPVEARWPYIQDNAQHIDIGEILDKAMVLIESENSSLENALPKEYSRPSLDKYRLGGLIKLIGTIGLGDNHSRAKDVLGRVYEYFLGKFAGAERKGGEFYTPQSVVSLLVEMLEPYHGTVYDPCCGSGGMFVQSEQFTLSHGGNADDIHLFGQELNSTTWRLCKMNLAIRGIKGNIGKEAADTFYNDNHKDLKADFILANPPFNASDWGGERLGKDPRWHYGLPSSNNANMAWVQHMIHHLSSSGFAGVVLTNGSLSSGQEEAIRRAMIEDDLIDCIVALPPQLFYNTAIASCLWIFSRDKKHPNFRNRSGETLFIYAFGSGSLVDRTHRELSDNDIYQIADTYHAWRNVDTHYADIPGFCKSANISEIKHHKWALVAGRYVGFDEKTLPKWDISHLREEAAQLEIRFKEVSQASESAITVLKELLHG
jgi:type I restriction enzyme M protein